MRGRPFLGTVLPVGMAVLMGGSAAACTPREDQGFRPRVPNRQTHADAPGAAGSAVPVVPTGAPERGPDQVGLATWYGGAFAGRKTSSGERFDPSLYTAAHRTLPLGTWVEVRRLDTGRSVRVRINDRGPFGNSQRIIDLSRRAAEDLDVVRQGVVRVEIRIVDGPS